MFCEEEKKNIIAGFSKEECFQHQFPLDQIDTTVT